MSTVEIHTCECSSCESGVQGYHSEIILFASRLDEQQRRWFAGLEAMRMGRGGATRMAEIIGLDPKTIRRGRRELATHLAGRPVEHVRAPGAGRHAMEQTDPNLEKDLLSTLEPETAGDPSGPALYKRSSLRNLRTRLRAAGHKVSHETIRRLLRKNNYSPKVNAKEEEESAAPEPEREAQFDQIEEQKRAHMDAGEPAISVDSKKKELIGNFKNAGKTWRKKPERVLAHDFPADGVGQARPYGIYDLAKNRGYVRVGNDHDTPRFAVESIAQWWREQGCGAYPHATRLLILADAGGSNSYRSRVWKQKLQEQLCDAFGLTVTVCHYPPGSSKWNPVEHRLFGFISMNWAGKPLRTFQALLGYIGQTVTRTGLAVIGALGFGTYQTGEEVSNAEWKSLNIQPLAVNPHWSYTLAPRTKETTASHHGEAI